MFLCDQQNLINVYCTQTFEKLAYFVLAHHQQHAYAVHLTSLNDSSTIFALLSDNSIYSIDLSILLHRTRNIPSSAASELCYRYVANVSLPTYKILALPTASGKK